MWFRSDAAFVALFLYPLAFSSFPRKHFSRISLDDLISGQHQSVGNIKTRVKVAESYWVSMICQPNSSLCLLKARVRFNVLVCSLCTKSINCFNSTQLDHSSFSHFVSASFLFFLAFNFFCHFLFRATNTSFLLCEAVGFVFTPFEHFIYHLAAVVMMVIVMLLATLLASIDAALALSLFLYSAALVFSFLFEYFLSTAAKLIETKFEKKGE